MDQTSGHWSDRGRNKMTMIHFMSNIRLQLTIWRFEKNSNKIDLWRHPVRAILVPIKRHIMDDILEYFMEEKNEFE
jgi:hypothetical protein